MLQVFWVPLQAPLQPLNTVLDCGSSVRVSVVPAGRVTKQEPPQLMLLLPTTVPAPTFETVTEGTSRLAAAFCAPIKLPSSPFEGAEQVGSMQRAWCVAGS